MASTWDRLFPYIRKEPPPVLCEQCLRPKTVPVVPEAFGCHECPSSTCSAYQECWDCVLACKEATIQRLRDQIRGKEKQKLRRKRLRAKGHRRFGVLGRRP